VQFGDVANCGLNIVDDWKISVVDAAAGNRSSGDVADCGLNVVDDRRVSVVDAAAGNWSGGDVAGCYVCNIASKNTMCPNMQNSNRPTNFNLT
jgi:hypothetical protein